MQRTLLPLLQASREDLKRIRDAAGLDKEIAVVDFSEPAQTARTFEAYRALLQTIKTEELNYVGVALLGPKSAVTSLTAGLALLR